MIFPKVRLRVIIFSIIATLIISFAVFPLFNEIGKSRFSNRFIGTWRSSSENVIITFNEDGTYITKNDGDIYRGKWEIGRDSFGYYINLNWIGYSADYRALFTNDYTQLRLVGISGPSGYIHLFKN